MQSRSGGFRHRLLSTVWRINPIAACCGALPFAALMAMVAHQAKAADVVCTPNPSGTVIASATETCSGSGDKVKYDVAPATVSSIVTLSGVNITGTAAGTTDGVAINPGTNNITVLTTGSGSITSIAGNGINVTATTGTGSVSIGTAANRINIPISGGNGLATAQGINVTSRGDISIFTGAVPITGTSTGGGSWSIDARDTLAGAGPGGAVVVDTQGVLTAGRGGILATTAGTDVTDTVTVTTTGAVTGLSGAGIQTSSVNGNTLITASGAVSGTPGAGNHGINATVSGTGNAAITTLAGGAVTGNAGAFGINVASGSGGLTLNIGANVTSTAAIAIKTVNSTATGTNAITIGSATIKGLGTSATTSIIDLTALTGGLTTLTTGAGTAIASNSATVAAQNGDLAITGTGGSVVVANGGSLRGRVDFSPITVASNAVTFNNSAALGWHSTGTSNFSAGNDVFTNTGLLGTNGVTILGFGAGTDIFNNNAGGSLFAAETAGASTTSLTGLETFNNAGTISLADNETNDTVIASGSVYVSSGAAKLLIDAALGAGVQSACPASGAQLADCLAIGASSGSGTVITVTDSNAAGAGVLNPTGLVVVDASSATPANFTLGGANVIATPQGAAIPKGFVQYQLFYDAANANFVLAGVPGAAMMEVGYAQAGVETQWRNSADVASERMATLRNAPAAKGWSFWAQGYYAQLSRDASQSAAAFGAPLAYDTSYTQTGAGVEFGADTRLGDSGDGAWTVGILAGYSSSHLRFGANTDRAGPSAWNIGGYAAYADPQFFADLLVKDDIGKVHFTFPGGANMPSSDASAIGVRLTAGLRLPQTSGLVFEPLVSLSYVGPDLGNVGDASAAFQFGDASSKSGTLGVRVSGVWDMGDGNLARPFAFIGVDSEFSGGNPVTITSGSQSLAWKDKPMRSAGDVKAGLDFSAGGQTSGYLAVGGLFASGGSGWTAQAGVRVALD